MNTNGSANLPPLARSVLMREPISRDESARLNEMMVHTRTRFMLLAGQSALGLENGDALALLSAQEVREHLGVEPSLLQSRYLGREHGDQTTYFSVEIPDTLDLEILSAVSTSAVSWLSLREHAPGLSDRDSSLFTAAVALSNWHASAEYSPLTGSPTIPAQGGWMRVEPDSGAEHFPRTDPAVIVLIEHEDTVLLGSHILWAADRYSLLAGFVEAGESLEAAVHREIFEEAGIRVTNIRYVASQPWPFPRSLMVGFTATLAENEKSTAITADETELSDLRWFTRDELRSNSESILLPGSASIARFMLDAWVHRQGAFAS